MAFRIDNAVDPELDAWPIERATVGFAGVNQERLESAIDVELFEVRGKLDTVQSGDEEQEQEQQEQEDEGDEDNEHKDEHEDEHDAAQIKNNGIEENVDEEKPALDMIDTTTESRDGEIQPVVVFSPSNQSELNQGPKLGMLMSTQDVDYALNRSKAMEFHKYDEPVPNNTVQEVIESVEKIKKNGDLEQDEEEDEVEGLFGAKMKISKWSLSYQISKKTSIRGKRVVAWSAWVICLLGLMISLNFVTQEFITSRKELASTVRYVTTDSLAMPEIWICNADTSLPIFHDHPGTKYIGQPLLWLDIVEGSNAHISLMYPDTNAMTQLSIRTANFWGRTCNASNVMDPIVFMWENYNKPACFHCLTLTRNPGMFIDRVPGEKALKELSSHVSFRVSMQGWVSRCRTSQYGLSMAVLSFFREELLRNHEELARRKILDYDGLQPGNGYDDSLLWPQYRSGYRNVSFDPFMYDLVDMFCNVYMFSGFFYPSSVEDVRYKFDRLRFQWVRNGKGPYYPKDFHTFYNVYGGKVLPSNGANSIGKELYENLSIYMGDTIHIMTNSSRIGGVETLSVMSPFYMVKIAFARNEILGKETYETRAIKAILDPGDKRSINFVYIVDMVFKSFLTRVVTAQHSMSWTAYLADFFGLTSLFLDISVYTVIVAPLVVKARRGFAIPIERLRALTRRA